MASSSNGRGTNAPRLPDAAPRTLEDLQAGRDAKYEIRLQLHPERLKDLGEEYPLDGEPVEIAEEHGPHKTLAVPYDKQYGRNEDLELLEWFSGLVKSPLGTEASENPVKEFLAFPSTLTKQERANWHHAADEAGLVSSSEGVGEERFLKISLSNGPKPAGDSLKGPTAGRKGSFNQRTKAKKLWDLCQAEGGPYLNYSQSEILEIVTTAAALPPDLARLQGKRERAKRLIQHLQARESEAAIELLDRDFSLAWVRDGDCGGYPLHVAAYQGLESVVSYISAKQRTTLEQRDRQHATPLQIAQRRRQDSVIKILQETAGKDVPASGAKAEEDKSGSDSTQSSTSRAKIGQEEARKRANTPAGSPPPEKKQLTDEAAELAKEWNAKLDLRAKETVPTEPYGVVDAAAATGLSNGAKGSSSAAAKGAARPQTTTTTRGLGLEMISKQMDDEPCPANGASLGAMQLGELKLEAGSLGAGDKSTQASAPLKESPRLSIAPGSPQQRISPSAAKSPRSSPTDSPIQGVACQAMGARPSASAANHPCLRNRSSNILEELLEEELHKLKSEPTMGSNVAPKEGPTINGQGALPDEAALHGPAANEQPTPEGAEADEKKKAATVAESLRGLEGALKEISTGLAAVTVATRELSAALQQFREIRVDQVAAAARLVLSTMPSPWIVNIDVGMRVQPAAPDANDRGNEAPRQAE